MTCHHLSQRCSRHLYEELLLLVWLIIPFLWNFTKGVAITNVSCSFYPLFKMGRIYCHPSWNDVKYYNWFGGDIINTNPFKIRRSVQVHFRNNVFATKSNLNISKGKEVQNYISLVFRPTNKYLYLVTKKKRWIQNHVI